MKKVLYLEGATGISGDMTVAALLDLGGNEEKLQRVLESLQLEGCHWHTGTRSSSSIAGRFFDVHLHHEEEEEHGHHHHHHHEEEGHHHHHHHEHRNLADVYQVIDRGEMSDGARNLAKKIFRIVAEAESAAHGVPIAEVHFHEVGALDSIVDIVSAAVLIDDLGIQECVVEGLTEGSGTVHCQHGILPVPVPAVLNIAAKYAIPLRHSQIVGELVTPTGIAIAAAICTAKALPEQYGILKVGCGVGRREIGRPNILRGMLLEVQDRQNDADIWVLESNIDDCTGEALGNALDEFFAAGARDAHFMPCFMKKNRPAWLLRCIVDKASLPAVEKAIFQETTTIGIRKYPVERTCMSREELEVATPYGKVRVKHCVFGEIDRWYPEYESVREVAKRNAIPFNQLFALVQNLCTEAAQ